MAQLKNTLTKDLQAFIRGMAQAGIGLAEISLGHKTKNIQALQFQYQKTAIELQLALLDSIAPEPIRGE